MYVQKPLAELDIGVMHDHIERHSFGALVLTHDGFLDANHVPFELDRAEGLLGSLRAHVSKANPVWRYINGEAEVLVIFQGNHAYVSPALHPARKTHRKVAPSWNYSAVHVRGKARAIDDSEWILNHLDRLTAVHESRRDDPWSLNEAPEDFILSAARYVVGIEITITEIVGKFQASQQYKKEVREAIITGLRNEPSLLNSEAVAQMMTSRNSMHDAAEPPSSD